MMKNWLKKISILYFPLITIRTLKHRVSIFHRIKLFFNFYSDYFKFKKLNNDRFSFLPKHLSPILLDNTENTHFDHHYVYHLAWAARKLAEIKPVEHTDISSSLYLSTMLSAFMPMKFYDYRPAKIILDNMTSGKADLLSLPFTSNSIKSLSCLHTIEHVGLGRYGDRVDPDGDLQSIAELKRVLAKGGDLLFVVPMGQPKIMFNAHRVYSYEQIISYFSGLKLQEFAFIPDNAKEIGMINDSSQVKNNFYGCGCFWFKKI